MGSTRRRFLTALGIFSGAATTLGAIAYRHAMSRAAELYRRIVEMPLESGTGSLSETSVATLMIATRAILPEGISHERYEDFFRWHAENAPGYRALYLAFEVTVDASAQGRGAKSFREAPREVVEAVLSKAKAVRVAINADDKLAAARLALFDREWFLFERYIIREVLTLFGRTDAWLLSGYGPHPGLPRGLGAYREPPK